MDKREAASVVAVIAAAFPQWPASKETVAVYADMLGDLDYVATAKAVRELVLTEDRWPTVATIRRTVGQQAGLLAPGAAQAWAEVTQQADDVGRQGRPVWSHPAVAETVRAIGWYDLCMSTHPETLRAQFTRMYEEAQRRHDRSVLSEPGRLALSVGTSNSQGGGQLAAHAL